ncbi:MAG TPA: hypothetical protein VFA49_05760, partial [Chloroflexota bacterium]|nr:hypothetical protein [Chloroflexota bacterium]
MRAAQDFADEHARSREVGCVAGAAGDFVAAVDADGTLTFPHRRFRHSYLFVNPEAGVTAARDLEGRSVGLRTWQTTAGLWTRGIL